MTDPAGAGVTAQRPGDGPQHVYTVRTDPLIQVRTTPTPGFAQHWCLFINGEFATDDSSYHAFTTRRMFPDDTGLAAWVERTLA